MSPTWRQRERGRLLPLRIFILLVRYCGRTVGRLVLYPAVLYFWVTAPRARRASAEFLECVRGQRAHFPAVFRHFYTFATTLLDRVLLFGGRESRLDVHLHNREVVFEADSHNQGCLMVTSHFGSFEVMRAIGRNQFDLPICMVMDRRPGAILEAGLKQLGLDQSAIIDGSRSQLDVILRIREALASGCWVGMMGDRSTVGQRSISCEFLGRRAEFPLTPWLIAASLGVPIILCTGLYRGGKRYDIYFEQITGPVRLKRSQREQQATRWAEQYVSRLETYARQAPYNWFNFYHFWEEEDAPINRPS